MPDKKVKNETTEIFAMSAKVSGRVQGVGFRYNCIIEARRLKLSGWVMNTISGDVEVWAEGKEKNLNDLFLWLKSGPPGARVENVSKNICKPTGKYRNFEIRT